MTNNINDAHQLRIKKLQESLSNISSEFGKNLATGTQNKKQTIDNIYPTTTPLLTQRQQKQSSETEKEPSVQEILQEIKQQVESFPKQNVAEYSKSWQVWKYIPREKLDYLEKKKLKFFKKQ